MLPTITGTGRILSNVEVRIGRTDKPYVGLALLFQGYKRDEGGGKWIEADSIILNCTAFTELAEAIVATFRKGDYIRIEGRIKQATWNDASGGTKSRPQVIIVEASKPEPSDRERQRISQAAASTNDAHAAHRREAADRLLRQHQPKRVA